MPHHTIPTEQLIRLEQSPKEAFFPSGFDLWIWKSVAKFFKSVPLKQIIGILQEARRLDSTFQHLHSALGIISPEGYSCTGKNSEKRGEMISGMEGID